MWNSIKSFITAALTVIIIVLICALFGICDFSSSLPTSSNSVSTDSLPYDSSHIISSCNTSSLIPIPLNSQNTSIPDISENTSDAVSEVIDSSQASAEIFPPEGSYYIEMKNIRQKPELPTGCEATALTIMLNYLGYDVDKCTIVDNYMPQTTKKYSMNTHFIGNPYSSNGIGCYAPVVVTTANNFFNEKGVQHSVKNITGASAEKLYQYVSQGQPVICWVTIGMMNTYMAKTWIAEDTGEKVEFWLNEHTTVLVGYDTVKKTVTVNDPWKGIVTYSMELFEKRYNQLGKQAIIIS